MKFNNSELKLGLRFYTPVSEDEYKIYSLVHIDEKKQICTLMDEESFTLEKLNKTEFEKKYVMLSNSIHFCIANFRLKPEVTFIMDESVWVEDKYYGVYKQSKETWSMYTIKLILDMVVYPFVKKSVFEQIINHIIQANFPEYKLLKQEATVTKVATDDFAEIYDAYLRKFSSDYVILELDGCDYSEDYDLSYIDSKKLLPDALIDLAEELTNSCIKTYDVYVYDDSINLNNVSMKYFFLHFNDTYYIVLYSIDTAREARMINDNLEKNMDVVEFMLK